MAPIEVVDLISDSEDDDHTSGNAASSTLKSFQPRKDKKLPRAHAHTTTPLTGPQPRTLAPLQPTQYAPIAPHTQYTPIAPSDQYTPIAPQAQHTPIAPPIRYGPYAPSTQHYAPIAPSTQCYGPIAPSTQHYGPIAHSSQYAPLAPLTTNYATIAPRSLQQYTNVGSNSVHGILRREPQSASLRAALLASKPSFAAQPATAPQQVNAQHEIQRQTIEPQEEREKHFEDYHRKEAERKGVDTPPQGQTKTKPPRVYTGPSSRLYTGASAGQGQISASKMADIINYAEPGENLDWTKISEPTERKRMQNIINGRKYRERRLAAEGHSGSGGNYPGASGVGSHVSPGYGQRPGGNNAGAGYLPVAPMLAPAAVAQPGGHAPPELQQSLTSSTNNAQPTLPHGRSLSPQSNGESEPNAKRPKLVHVEEADDVLGMREARRLSAATIGINEAGGHSSGTVPSLPVPATAYATSNITASNSNVEGVSHSTSPNPAVVGPAGPDQINQNVQTATEIPPANNASTAKENAKGKGNATGKGKAAGKAKAEVNNAQPTLEEATTKYMEEFQQKVVNKVESLVGMKPERGKPRKPPQPKYKTAEGAKHVKEWQDSVVRMFDKAFGMEDFSDTDEDDNTPIWERPTPKPEPQDSDSESSSSEESSGIIPSTSKPASKPTRPFSGRGKTHTASDTEYTSGSDEPSPDVGPSRSRFKNSIECPNDGDVSPPLFVLERSKSNSLAGDLSDGNGYSPLFVQRKSKSRNTSNSQSDSETSSSDVVPARSTLKSQRRTRADTQDSSPDVIPARSKPSRLPSDARPMDTKSLAMDHSDSDSSSPNVITARPRHKALPKNSGDFDRSSPDIVPARTQSTRQSLIVKLRPKSFGVTGRSDRDSSSPGFVPAKGNITASVPRENEALKNFLSQPIKTAPMLAINSGTGPQKEIETNAKPTNITQQTKPTNTSGSNHGIPYTKEEDDLLKYLREERKVSWDEMIDHFSGRTRGSLQVRYSTKLKNRASTTMHRKAPEARVPSFAVQATATSQEYAAPARRAHKAPNRGAGMVSWAEIKAKRREEHPFDTPEIVERQESVQPVGSVLDVAIPASIPRLLRSREMGNTGSRNWSSKARSKIPDELQNHVLDTLGPSKFFHGASRDVTCVAWANDGNRFAAGAIAIDDERSMQYNRPNNLLLGHNEKNSLKELPEHHVSRPAVSDSNNVNSLHAMQETQDPRLFKTVAAVAFSGDDQALYSAGGDGIVRMYDSSNGQCQKSYSQGADVVLLTANSRGLLASGCHRSDDSSISVLSPQLDLVCKLGPSRTNVQSSLPIFPSALKWGVGRHSSMLLAGFASDSYDEDRLAAGEVCLWNVAAEIKIELPTVRNVFDVAWNPCPSPASTLFAVACTRSGRTYRSSIECFAPHQDGARSVLKWDCQAFDINDVLYCPHDDSLIAAGATDGKVYIWDKRFSKRGQAPLHIFAHGPTKNVLDPERNLEIADTGVRFLSWSATGNRLFSGSSDGTVKVWNPYRTTEDALVRNVATFNSAIMSGAFSPDYRELLIGEDQGQLNLLGIDREDRPVRAAKNFDYYPAAKLPPEEDKLAPARELFDSGQIEFKPMGALPKKQVVQGPNYQSCFLASSDEQRQHLVTEHHLALQQEKKALAILPRDAETKKLIKSAQLQVSQTRDALQRAQQKTDDFKSLEAAASLLQAKFRESRHAWKKVKIDTGAKTCRLDCNYLPAAGDDDGEAPDNRRSEQRVPGTCSLRPQRKILAAGDMTNSEVAEAGLTSKCIACTGPAARPKRGLPLCENCSLSRAGLTARCSKCATPTRPNLNEGEHPNICERCNFHCFRCGSVAAISPEGDTVTCESCSIQWEAGALGYEVKTSLKLKPAVARLGDEESLDREMESLEQRMVRSFGDDERERLAGGWKVALVDGS